MLPVSFRRTASYLLVHFLLGGLFAASSFGALVLAIALLVNLSNHQVHEALLGMGLLLGFTYLMMLSLGRLRDARHQERQSAWRFPAQERSVARLTRFPRTLPVGARTRMHSQEPARA
ncbi:hypothetical protein [Rubellimicrobium arenae]|uniref:hypothetical protein n=1 Tax=Rubellimicrobium arenae TaxID=2817372 RepID=UPI001B303FC1|nr:hypothetical protein [Rubellimicrobium arenae]